MKRYSGIFVACVFALSICFVSNASASEGEKLTKKKCKACHFIPGIPHKGKKAGGDLAGVASRTDAVWLDKWLKSPKDTWKAGGGYTDTLIKAAGGRKKPKMMIKVKKDAQRKVIVEYLMTLK